MNVLDAKIIPTARGLEIYLDVEKSIKIKDIHIPTMNSPFYEIQFGIEYFLLREKKYYDSEMNYFSIRMNHDFSLITFKEPETESLFAVKNEDEKEATKKGPWKDSLGLVLTKRKELG